MVKAAKAKAEEGSRPGKKPGVKLPAVLRAYKKTIGTISVFAAGPQLFREWIGVPAAIAAGLALAAGAGLWLGWESRGRAKASPSSGEPEPPPRWVIVAVTAVTAAAALVAVAALVAGLLLFARWLTRPPESRLQRTLEWLDLDREVLAPAAGTPYAIPGSTARCEQTADGALHLHVDRDARRQDDWAASCCLELQDPVRIPASSFLRGRLELAVPDEVELKVEEGQYGFPVQVGWAMKDSLNGGARGFLLPLLTMPRGQRLAVPMRAERICIALVNAGPTPNDLWLREATRQTRRAGCGCN